MEFTHRDQRDQYIPTRNGKLFIPDAPCECNIYLHEWHRSMINVGKYSIHGAYGYGFGPKICEQSTQ